MKRVLCHGCFDVLHIGHFRLLKEARKLGDELWVSLLADEYVRMYKGQSRPIHNLSMRMEQMEELRCVDRVVVVNGPGHKAVELMIERVKPAVYVKGADTKGTFGEEEFVRRKGIEMVFIDMVKSDEGESSTSRLLKAWMRIGAIG